MTQRSVLLLVENDQIIPWDALLRTRHEFRVSALVSGTLTPKLVSW